MPRCVVKVEEQKKAPAAKSADAADPRYRVQTKPRGRASSLTTAALTGFQMRVAAIHQKHGGAKVGAKVVDGRYFCPVCDSPLAQDENAGWVHP